MNKMEDLNLQRLKWAIQALASTAKQQVLLFPDFVCPGDELVLEFDEYFKITRKTIEFSEPALKALNSLDDFIEKHSDDNFQRMYLKPSGLNEPEWIEIRNLAKKALDEFGWELEVPPKKRGDFFIK
jgi:hypothetical protein